TASTRSKRGSLVFIPPLYPPPPFPKTTPQGSEPEVIGRVRENQVHGVRGQVLQDLAEVPDLDALGQTSDTRRSLLPQLVPPDLPACSIRSPKEDRFGVMMNASIE